MAATDAAPGADTSVVDTGTTDTSTPPDTGVVGDTGVVADARDGGSTGDASGDASVDAPFDAPVEAEAAPPATAITYTATLDGNQEPPSTTVSTATGTATLTLSADRTTLTYHIVHNVVGATQAHIHLGAGGEYNGPVIYPLPLAASGDAGVPSLDGGATMSAIDGAIALSNGPDAGLGLTLAQVVGDLEMGLFYINIHSAAYAGGEIRGQILHPGETLYVATLTGKQEVPTPVTTTAGVSGDSAVIVNPAKNTLTYHLKTTGLTPLQAHIHSGIGGTSGGVLVTFAPIGGTVDGVQSLVGTDGGLIADPADLLAGRWYVNVHTAANPGGEIRGQLLRPGQVLYTALMTGANEVPPNPSTATGGAQFILDTTKTSLSYEAVFTGFTATQAHIHSGTVGTSGAVVYTLNLIPPAPAAATGVKGTQTVTSADVANLDGALYYANAHSTLYTAGEIRGQIIKQ